MHKYMRAIGFSKRMTRSDEKELLRQVVDDSDEEDCTMRRDGVYIVEFCKHFSDRIGIAVCGDFDDDEDFHYEYYFPYLRSSQITSREHITVERNTATESYTGMCDELKVGVSLIFFLQNRMNYVVHQTGNRFPMDGMSVTLSALSLDAMILLPVKKNESQKKQVIKDAANRQNLMNAARSGDEEAMETLTLDEMDTYSMISKRIRKEDIFSMVDSYFMPYGVECDHYSILGEILEVELVRNELTGERIYLLKICCNELTFDVAINIIDLCGEPKVGRRFKGSIWLQGKINFPDDELNQELKENDFRDL